MSVLLDMCDVYILFDHFFSSIFGVEDKIFLKALKQLKERKHKKRSSLKKIKNMYIFDFQISEVGIGMTPGYIEKPGF